MTLFKLNRVKASREGSLSLKDVPALVWILSFAAIFIILGELVAFFFFLFWVGIFLFFVAILYAILWFISLFS
jgi:hypothetical protein